jgi:hypothetical protein
MSRIVSISIVSLVVAACLAPAALAERPDDRAGVIGVGGASVATVSAARPDDSGAQRGPGAFASTEQTSVRPDDRAGVRGPGLAPTVFLTQTPSSGFDWGDAGIGALGAFGLALLLFGTMQVVTRQRRSHAAA